ncbi:helix-turn-helix domain-containing protein [Streptomyces zhihengii]|uniref:Helix-turn-helix transcriptional regulator n=1 Tax=Streptomyces zhihengii TaxID=1818004 RepID=A0ABS2UXD4_9ACTN|nr:helix-turn-helix transcriptional regulator [Streptomyces zhihengii]MBM9622231.1 helix-turn-helix transcriptional regulator [Streptomyces zhihengii]
MPDVTPMRAARLAAGLSAAEVSRRIGLHSTAITLYKTGRSTPSVSVLHNYAKAVGMTTLADALAPLVATFPRNGRTAKNDTAQKRGAA